MVFRVTLSTEAEHDFELIFEFLVESYVSFGETIEQALGHALERIQDMRADTERIAKAPYRGTLHDDLLPGLRHVTLGRAIVWFEVVEASKEIRVLALFFGGQDHRRRMMARLLAKQA